MKQPNASKIMSFGIICISEFQEIGMPLCKSVDVEGPLLP